MSTTTFSWGNPAKFALSTPNREHRRIDRWSDAGEASAVSTEIDFKIDVPEITPVIFSSGILQLKSSHERLLEGFESTEFQEIPSWSFRLTSEGFNATLKSIEDLENAGTEEEEDDGYPTTPSQYAIATSLRTVKLAGAHLCSDVPAGRANADVGGGIRISWELPTREVLLVIPGAPGGRGYIYTCWNSGSDVSAKLSPDTLAAKLQWLKQE